MDAKNGLRRHGASYSYTAAYSGTVNDASLDVTSGAVATGGGAVTGKPSISTDLEGSSPFLRKIIFPTFFVLSFPYYCLKRFFGAINILWVSLHCTCASFNLTDWPIARLIRPIPLSLTHRLTDWLTDWLTHSRTHSLTMIVTLSHSLINSVNHSLPGSLHSRSCSHAWGVAVGFATTIIAF